jgi:hypothetical protein
MSQQLRAGFIAAFAALIMTLGVASATAGRLSVSNRNIRVTFNNLEMTAERLGTDSCHVTLEGSLHSSTIAKTAGPSTWLHH